MRATGEFAYCVIRHSYPNGIELSLARSPEGLFFIGLKNPAWTLERGDEARARVAVDDAAGRSESATVVSSDTVLFTFWPRDAAAYSDLLSAGTRLTVADLSVTPHSMAWQFDLTGTRDALDALGRCVVGRGASATASVRK